MIKQKIFNRRMCAFLIAALLLFELAVGLFGIRVSASDRQGSDVISDLKQDYTFNMDNYPVIQGNADLQVIQIAESTQGEVLVYVYQPNETPGKYRASSINISAALHDSLQIKNYYLNLVDYDGVFQKYVVKDLTIPDGNTRYYDVVSIYRMFDETIDEKLDDDNDNSIDEVVYKVGKQYTITSTADGVNIDVKDTEVVTITDKFVGFIRYPDGVSLFDTAYNPTDSHFVAFSTDRDIDKLYEADVYYTTQSYKWVWNGYAAEGEKDTYTWGDQVSQYAYLNYTQDASYTTDGLFQRTYSWKRIESITEFMENIGKEQVYECGIFNVVEKQELTETAKANLQSKQWVLRFCETELYTNSYPDVMYAESSTTIVGNVTILRLKFETDGVVYNLGVIDNKQTGSLLPSNTTEYEVEAADWWQKIMMILCVILVVAILTFLSGPLSLLGRIIWDGFKFVLSIILWVATLPFRLIGNLFKRR